jgi:hypothetical protein
MPRLFDTLNRGMMYQTLDEARHRYERLSEEQRASACIQCRECESKWHFKANVRSRSLSASEWCTWMRFWDRGWISMRALPIYDVQSYQRRQCVVVNNSLSLTSIFDVLCNFQLQLELTN